MTSQLEIYKKYFANKNFERLSLFEKLKDRYQVKSALYLGSFVHITPALVFPETAFVDNDRRVQKFFKSPEVRAFVLKNKQYTEEPEVFVSQQNYEKPIAISEESYDLLISQYAGFVSQAGKKYLNLGGILVVNNSHGDAAMAFLDPDYELIAVANHTNDVWRISDKSLADYFVPKRGNHPTVDEVRASMKGVDYTKTAANYIFKRVS